MLIRFNLPVGRVVEGPQVQGWHQFAIRIAIDKSECNNIIPGLWIMGSTIKDMQFINNVTDGDSPEHRMKDGWVGCYVFTFLSPFPVPCFDRDVKSMDASLIKSGHFVRAHVCHVPAGDRGYLNIEMLQFVAFAREITSRANTTEAKRIDAEKILAAVEMLRVYNDQARALKNGKSFVLRIDGATLIPLGDDRILKLVEEHVSSLIVATEDEIRKFANEDDKHTPA
jgi:hypothetical protein